MPSKRPEGYFTAVHEDGRLTIQENDPGLHAVRLHWKPVGNFDADRDHEFRMPLEVWNKVVAQKVHEEAVKKAVAEAEKAKVVTHGAKRTKDVQSAPGSEGGGPGF
jgi:hypothetical protein